MFADLQRKAALLIAQNASTILTGVGAVGTVGTAVLTGRASYKSALVIREETLEAVIARGEKEAEQNNDKPLTDEIIDPLSLKDKVLLVWPEFVPPVVLGGATVGAIIMASRVSAKQAAALAAAYSVSEKNLEEYKAKALEKLGKTKGQAVEDEVAQDRVNEKYRSEMIIVGDGDVLFMDMLTGRFFMSSVEKVSTAMAKIHSSLYNNMYASFSEFCQELDLEPTEYTDQVGWNTDDVPEVRYSTSTTPDNRPCMTLTFSVTPKPGYSDLY